VDTPRADAGASVAQIAVVIPAGGGGTRLWPRSREHTPKQFLDIVSDRTMLQETVDRVRPLVPPERIFVVTNARHVAAVREQLPDVPPGNVVGEPVGRESAPAVGLMAALIERRLGPGAVIAMLPSDHVIVDDDRFRTLLSEAIARAESGYLMTLGIPPTSPDTGFGYIHAGETLPAGRPGVAAHVVLQFKEKPKRDLAERYLATGEYYWNAGMYIATVATLRGLFRKHVPQMEDAFARIVDGLDQGDESVLHSVFPTIDKISFDYAIAEKADRVAVIPADMGWNDVGSWARLAEVLSASRGGENIIVGSHIGIDTTGSLIHSPHRLVATIGLDDVVIIDTPDVTLVCAKSRSEDVKKIVEALRERGDHHLL
jgi:mannose-1-phosphate guanylyltransferase